MRHSSGWVGVSFLLVGTVVAAACSTPPEPLADANDAYSISAAESPEVLVAAASRRLVDTISADDVGRDFGVPSWRVPYPDTYWPFIQGGTDASWNRGARDPRTPIEKYMAITAPYATELAKMWEFMNHGQGVFGVDKWHGHCPGWAAAATTSAPVTRPVFATADGRGGIAPCREGDYGCVRFEIGDVNALMAEIYLDGPASLIGSTCNTPAGMIPRDVYGRVLKQGCAGVNAGSLLVTAATLLKKYRVPFAMDAQNPTTTAEIWNQPTYRYHVYDYHPLTMAKAANLVARGAESGPERTYWWNPAARGFAFVDLGLHFVGENGPQLVSVSGLQSTYELRVAAVIELDADAADSSARIIGGEYLDLPSSRANRLTVPPFLWVARGSGPESLPEWIDGSRHNPYVRPSLVKQLAALGQQ